jgi:hypothetical protein
MPRNVRPMTEKKRMKPMDAAISWGMIAAT